MRTDYKCEKCAHKAICMYSDDIIKLIGKLRNQCADELDHIHTLSDINLIIDIVCPHYLESKPIERKSNFEPYKLPTTITTESWRDNCTGCEYADNKSITTIGDSPCTWCSRSNLKITCESRGITE